MPNLVPILDLHQTAGNRAVQRLLRPEALGAPGSGGSGRGMVSAFHGTSDLLVVQRAEVRIWDERPERFIDRLFALSQAEALNVIAVTSDRVLLRQLAKELEDRRDGLGKSTEPAGQLVDQLHTVHRWLVLRVALIERVTTLDVVDRVIEVAKGKGSDLTNEDEEKIKKELEGLPPHNLKEIEKEIVIWPDYLPRKAKQQTVDLVTGPLRLSDVTKDAQRESERGHFGTAEGAEIRKRLLEAHKLLGTESSKCLMFLEKATKILHGMSAEEWEIADARYREGVVEREKGYHEEGTLSRLAAELRAQGVLGPINFLPWQGSPAKGGHKDPTPQELLDRLSSKGAGWYFFYVSQFGHHTRMIAVEVSAGGARRYLLIEHLVLMSGAKPAERDISGKVNETFDEFNRVDQNAKLGSNVWQVYYRPQGN